MKDSNINRDETSFAFGRAGISFTNLYFVLALLLFGLLAFQLWFHAVRTSTTVDEAQHIVAGYRHLQCGDFAINPEHPPFLKLLAAAPLFFQTVIEPDGACGAQATDKQTTLSNGFTFLTRNGADNIIIPARLAAAMMSLLLAALVFLAALEMFGLAEAVLALGLLAFEPNIIAHGSLVTTDMAVTAGMFAAVYAFYRFRQKATLTRFLLLGAAIGLTLAVKHSGILIVPILFLILIADIFRSRENKPFRIRQIFKPAMTLAGAILIGWAFLWASYGFRYYALPDVARDTILEEVFPPRTPQGKPPSTLRQIIKTASRVFPEAYIYGLADVVSSGSREMMLLGKVYPTGQWFYFPVAFSIKTSLPLLILLAASLPFAIRLYREHPREMLFLLLPALCYLLLSLFSKMNIGIRHILPLYPFLILFAAAGACALYRKHYVARFAVIALLVFHAATAVRTAPNYLAFSNDLWGGTNNTHRYLADSNVEWGQNLKLVNEYLAAEGITDCRLADFAGGELARASQPCRLLPGSFGWNPPEQLIEPVPPVIEGTILLSVAALPPVAGDEYLPVIKSQPVTLIGGSVFVYRGRFEAPLAAALSHSIRAGQLVKLNRFDEAVAAAREAVRLAPEQARSHLSLGEALVKTGQTDEARVEFETAIRLAQNNPPCFDSVEPKARRELEILK